MELECDKAGVSAGVIMADLGAESVSARFIIMLIEGERLGYETRKAKKRG